MRGLVGSWLVAACLALGAVPGQSAERCELLQLMNTRLGLMQQVAAHKWHNALAIEDRAREAQVLERSVGGALRVRLMPATAELFFRAQIEAAKAVQGYWFARWAAGEAPPAADTVPDLVDVIRPRLLSLGAQILDAVGEDPACHSRQALDDALDVAGMGEAQAAALYAAIAGLEFFANHLQQVKATSQLRVGTTGDYAPFSHRASVRQPFAGVDIDLARDLAATLAVSVVFVPTSWPRLMADLDRGAFDIAMSGVSITAERQRSAYFSVPYYTGGKTPIARCEDADRFASLQAIDRPDVRVIVNPGGTNERFVAQHIRRAEVLRHPDNRSIFGEIIERRADVMITDRIEVLLQSARNSELCSTMAVNLNRQQKAYLLPQDEVWQQYVDTWLNQRLRDGAVAAAFSGHGVSLDR